MKSLTAKLYSDFTATRIYLAIGLFLAGIYIVLAISTKSLQKPNLCWAFVRNYFIRSMLLAVLPAMAVAVARAGVGRRAGGLAAGQAVDQVIELPHGHVGYIFSGDAGI